MSEATDWGARISGARETVGALALGVGRALELCETRGELRAELAATVGARGGWNRVGGGATELREGIGDALGIAARGGAARCDGASAALDGDAARLAFGERGLADFPLSRESV